MMPMLLMMSGSLTPRLTTKPCPRRGSCGFGDLPLVVHREIVVVAGTNIVSLSEAFGDLPLR